MLRVDHIHVIRHKVLVEGKGIREVAREMGVSRITVRKYLRQPEPVRVERGPRRRPVFEAARPAIDRLLDEWGARTTPKQRLTATRLHRQLVEDGHPVGITLVRGYLRERRRQVAEVFVPLVHRPGDEAQIDFFDVTVEIDGVRCRAWMFLMRLMHSGRDFAWLYERCDQISFLDGHVRAFAHFGAVPLRGVYDNLSPAVRRVVLPRRELTERFAALARHYLFEPCFARVGEGHDKGGVEARGKGVRLQHLTPIPRGDSLASIATALLRDLDQQATTKRDAEGRSVAERFRQEIPHMLPLLDPPFEPRRTVTASISSRSMVKVEGAHYSVPSHWARLEATAYVGVEDVRFVCRGETHLSERKRFGERSIRYRHYLDELSRKPQAVRQVAAELIAELGEPFDRLWRLLVDTHGPREAARVFARVLGAAHRHGDQVVAAALRESLDVDALDRRVLALSPPAPVATIAVPPSLLGYEIESARAVDFDGLLAGGCHE